ncbi:MAG TPA: hypothetical protein VFS62_18420, partial [Chloroflexota bacterium]|nr:hypothetical protein [Chloroflexota bacterium]
MPTRSLILAMAVVAGLAAPGAAYAQSSANPPASGASTGLPNLPTMTVGTAPTKQYTGPGWTVQVPADWGNDPSDATTVGGITAGKCLMGLSVGHKAATGTLEAVVAGEVKTAPGPATPAPATVDNQPGAILDVPFSDGTASGSEYVWLENGEQWTATFVQVLCDKSVANDWAAELNLFKTQIWPTFAVNAGASPNAAAASGAAANTSIDSSTLVTYTGTGYSISLPPGWTPASSSPGTVGGKLPDGSIGVLVVQNTDAGAQGLDVLAPAAVQGMST